MSGIDDAIERSALLRGRDVKVSALAGGSAQGVFLAEVDDRRYVVRVPSASSELLGTDRGVERSNADIAAQTRGPGVRGRDRADGRGLANTCTSPTDGGDVPTTACGAEIRQ